MQVVISLVNIKNSNGKNDFTNLHYTHQHLKSTFLYIPTHIFKGKKTHTQLTNKYHITINKRDFRITFIL